MYNICIINKQLSICLGIFLIVADTALFIINIGNTWSA